MTKTFLRAAAMAAIVASGSMSAMAADPILGTWARPNGTLELISPCGDMFCVTVASGDFSGKKAGSFKSNGDGTYVGKLTEMRTGITFSGKGKLSGNSFALSAAGGLMSETWKRQ